MEKECECYEEEVQPYRKTDYKPIIYILVIEPDTQFSCDTKHFDFFLKEYFIIIIIIYNICIAPYNETNIIRKYTFEEISSTA